MPKDDFIINPDGTITKKRVPSSNSGGSSDNTGCIWAVVIAVCVIVGIIIAVNNNSSNDSSYPKHEPSESNVISGTNDSEEEGSTYVEETSHEATYLSVSKNSVTFDYEGGYVDIDIDSNGEWEIGTSTADWGHLSKYTSSIRLSVDSYPGDEERTGWFTIKAGDYEERIDITQRAEWKECGNCDGRGYTSCSHCNNGYRSCSYCNNGYTTCTNSNYTGVVDNIGQYGHGRQVPVYTYDPWTGMQLIAGYRLEVCPTCGGSYRVKCSHCEGSGRAECSYCDGEGETECSRCDGRGKIRN